MSKRALTCSSITQLTRVLSDVVNELLHIFNRHLAIHNQNIWRSANHSYWCEVFNGIVGNFSGCRIGAMCSNITLHKGISIRCRSHRCLRGDHSTTATLILYNKSLTEHTPPTLSNNPRNHVVTASSGYGNNVANRFCGE